MTFRSKRKEPQVAQLTVADLLEDLENISKMSSNDFFGSLYTSPPPAATNLHSFTRNFDEKIIDHPSISPEKEFANASQATVNAAFLAEKKDQNVNLHELYQKTYESSKLYIWLVDWLNSSKDILASLPSHLENLQSILQKLLKSSGISTVQ